ncbi:MAG: polyprenyl synthetase family protein [Acidobacteriota bacterium]|nr:polyprenyl synthetase family protein [Acidobacteriota bacterium]
MAPSISASPATHESAAPSTYSGLLIRFRDRLEAELASWLAAKRAAADGAAFNLELIDGIARLVVQGGKRLRPALVYFTYRACGTADPATSAGAAAFEAAAVLPLALATELLHTYLLIHDDIMDHAEVRRGQPAAHIHFRDLHRTHGLAGDAADFGNSVAILLGDLAHTWAVELFTSLPELPAAVSRRELTRCFSAMCEEVIGGQYLELLAAQRRAAAGGDRQTQEAELMQILRLKSGRYTAERPIQLGALLAGAPQPAVEALSAYGNAVGEAFQLQDDLLGMFGDSRTVGKPVGADLAEGKFTFLIHHALAAASPAQRQAIESALGNPRLAAKEIADVQSILEETGARHAVLAMVAERLRAARAALATLSLRPEGRTFLAGLLDVLRERES